MKCVNSFHCFDSHFPLSYFPLPSAWTRSRACLISLGLSKNTTNFISLRYNTNPIPAKTVETDLAAVSSV